MARRGSAQARRSRTHRQPRPLPSRPRQGQSPSSASTSKLAVHEPTCSDDGRVMAATCKASVTAADAACVLEVGREAADPAWQSPPMEPRSSHGERRRSPRRRCAAATAPLSARRERSAPTSVEETGSPAKDLRRRGRPEGRRRRGAVADPLRQGRPGPRRPAPRSNDRFAKADKLLTAWSPRPSTIPRSCSTSHWKHPAPSREP